MILTARTRFKEGDKGWEGYISFLKLPYLREVRSLDSGLNGYVNNGGDLIDMNLNDLWSALGNLPKIENANQYYLLAVSEYETGIEDLINNKTVRFLGCDLAESTGNTSSLLNCGPWEGPLSLFNERRNEYGLLDLSEAKHAKDVLSKVWDSKDPHAHVHIYGLYEFLPTTEYNNSLK